MKNLICILMFSPIIFFTSCSKEDNSNNISDIRDQMTGEYNGAGTMVVTNLDDQSTSSAATIGSFACEKSGSSNINIILDEFGPGNEDLIITCNQITEIAGGLTFYIIETDGISMLNPDESSGPPWILNGVDGPQTYTSIDNSLNISFEMENAQYMFEVSISGIK
jgi:hypothetical protein